MNLQQQRRHTPYPHTWEIPALAAITIAYLLTVGVHAGRGAANLTACGAWQWPDASAWFTSLPGVLAGDAAAGITILGCAGASGGVLMGSIVALELVVVVLVVVLGKWALDRWGPGRLKGMATPTEATQLLGVERLRRVRRTIRPDLYSRKATR